MNSDEEMTAYERRRLENIKRNSEMLASLNVNARLSDLASSSKRLREEKSYKQSSGKKKKPEEPVVIRRSLRTQGIPPDSKGLRMDFNESLAHPSKKTVKLLATAKPHPAVMGPLSMKDAYDMDEGSYRTIVEKFTNITNSLSDDVGKSRTRSSENGVPRLSSSKVDRVVLDEPIDVKAVKLESENIARVVPGKIGSLRFIPTTDMAMTVTGNKCGHLGFWDVKPKKEDEDVIHLSMKDAYDMDDGSYRTIAEKFTNITDFQSDDVRKSRTRSSENGFPRSWSKVDKVILDEPMDMKALKLESENIARVVPGKIGTLRFIPTMDMTMIVAGNKFGHLGFWDVKPKREDEDVIHLYQPHTAPISGIHVHPFSLSKVYSSSYDGFVRFMDIEKEEFSLLYSSSESCLYSLSLQPNDANLVYIGEGQGDLKVIDGRVGEITNSWSLHDMRINTIDFNPANPYIMATSSSDTLVCLWDLRKLDVKHRERGTLLSLQHKRAVHSAFFSPSGSSVATTSVDDNIGVICGVNLEDKIMIPHDNKTNRWISTFRAIWGWDDTHLFVGNMQRRVDVVSVKQRKTITKLESSLMTAIPCRYDAHPCSVGMLAGATSGGQIYIWTTSL